MNTGIHFPVSKDVIFYNLLKAFYHLGIADKCKLSYAIVAHEHGEKNMKCQLQKIASKMNVRDIPYAVEQSQPNKYIRNAIT